MLKTYINSFDEVIFCIVSDNTKNYDLINELRIKILEMYSGNSLTFKLYDNTEYRESYVFYNEIASKTRELDGLTFFAHNKGMSYKDSIDGTIKWVAALYYFNLEVNCVFKHLSGKLFYGALKSIKIKDYPYYVMENKYNWVYCGTFYWGRYQDVYRYLQNRQEEIPKLTNRWYDENFPGDICDMIDSTSYMDIYIENMLAVSDNIDSYLSSLYYFFPNVIEDFNLYYNKIIEELE
jgi:hypothetical protein